MLGLLKYNYKVYIKTNKFLIYTLLFVVSIIFYNNSTNLKYNDSISFSMNILFIIMVLIGYKYSMLQDLRTEQIIYLKVSNSFKYWFSKIIFIISISFCLVLVGTILSFIFVCMDGGSVSLYENCTAFILQLVIGSIGGILGLFFNNNLKIKKNYSIMILSVIVLLSELKTYILMEWSYLKIFRYIIPPINEIVIAYNEGNIIVITIFAIIYMLLGILLYIGINMKRLF